MRTCLGCRQKKDKFALVRFVTSRQGLIIDPDQTKAGRGYYVCPDLHCVNALFKAKRLNLLNVNISQQQKQKIKNQFTNMIKPNRVYSLVGFARRAGKVAIGNQAVAASIKNQQAKLIFVSEDGSQNTKKQFNELAERAQIQIKFLGLKQEWGNLLGRNQVAVFAILHKDFASSILNEME